MRSSFLLALVALALPHAASAQACDGDVVLTTQAEVDAFACSAVTGGLRIGESGGPTSDIDDLSPLAGLADVGGYFVIENTALANLDGLDGLVALTGSLGIRNNQLLTSLDGLGALETIGGSLGIVGNHALPSFAGIDRLVSVGSDMRVTYNSMLVDLTALAALSHIGGSLTLQNNESLSTCSCGLNGLIVSGSFENVEGFSYISQNAWDGTCSSTADVLSSPCSGDPCDTNVSLRTQDDVDAFACTSVHGYLSVLSDGEPAIVDLTPLDGLERVDRGIGFRRLDGVASLDGLNALTSVGGLSLLDNPDLATVSGLRNLTEVRGEIVITRNESLTALPAWTALSDVGGSMHIDENPMLASLDGLEALDAIGGSLTIEENEALSNIDALRGLTNVGDDLWLRDNPALSGCRCALDGLRDEDVFVGVGGSVGITGNDPSGTCASTDVALSVSCDGATCYRDVTLGSQASVEALTCSVLRKDLRIHSSDASDPIVDLTPLGGVERVQEGLYVLGTPSLQSLTGLSGLTELGGSLYVQDNAALTSFGLPSLERIGGDLWVRRNGQLASLDGLGTVTAVEGMVSIVRNASLTSFDGLQALASVGQDMTVNENDALTGLDGLDVLTSVGGTLSIRENDVLESLDGFGALGSIGGGLYVRENPRLDRCRCGLDGLIADGAFVGVEESVGIGSNAPEGRCNSPSDVIAVVTSDERGPTAALAVSVMPNPVAGLGRVAYALPHPGPARVTVFDALGRRVAALADGPHTAGEHEAAWATDDLPPGLYLVRLDAEADRVTVPVVVAR